MEEGGEAAKRHPFAFSRRNEAGVRGRSPRSNGDGFLKFAGEYITVTLSMYSILQRLGVQPPVKG